MTLPDPINLCPSSFRKRVREPTISWKPSEEQLSGHPPQRSIRLSGRHTLPTLSRRSAVHRRGCLSLPLSPSLSIYHFRLTLSRSLARSPCVSLVRAHARRIPNTLNHRFRRTSRLSVRKENPRRHLIFHIDNKVCKKRPGTKTKKPIDSRIINISTEQSDFFFRKCFFFILLLANKVW